MLLYTKCAFCPLVLLALLWFVCRLYSNDLYIAIPDRALAAAALALFLQDLPTTEVFVLLTSSPSPYLKLLDVLSCAAFLCSILFFWVVFAQDKLAKNEHWERNTR